MRTKRLFLTVSITALILTVVLISIKAYYVAITLIAGALIMGHRELWSLLRKRKFPVIDERVRGNLNKSVRNGFIFFALASAFLMLPFSTFLIETPSTGQVLGGMLVSGGAVYLLSYLFYDRAEPKLDDKGLRRLKIFMVLAGISVGSFIISVFLHNALSGLLGVEEPVFFIIAVIISPLAFAVGFVGSLIMLFKGLLSKA